MKILFSEQNKNCHIALFNVVMHNVLRISLKSQKSIVLKFLTLRYKIYLFIINANNSDLFKEIHKGFGNKSKTKILQAQGQASLRATKACRCTRHNEVRIFHKIIQRNREKTNRGFVPNYVYGY